MNYWVPSDMWASERTLELQGQKFANRSESHIIIAVVIFEHPALQETSQVPVLASRMVPSIGFGIKDLSLNPNPHANWLHDFEQGNWLLCASFLLDLVRVRTM